MRTKAVIFTCLKHIEAAKIAAAAASRHFDVVIALDGNESVGRVYGNIITTKFNRNGNLNGLDCVRGIATTLLSMCASGYAVKIDSDTIVKDSSQLIGYDIAGFPQSNSARCMFGACYGISRRALEHVISKIDNEAKLEPQTFPEDVIITGYAHTLAKNDFKSNIIPLKKLGVWHPKLAPVMKGKIANFGTYRINGEWCHAETLAAMRHFANS